MPKKGYKQTEEHKEKLKLKALEQFKDGMPQETKDKIGKTFKMHKSNCQCAFCKAKRGERSGKNNPQFIEGLTKKGDRYFISTNSKKMRYSRYVAEKHLQRKLTKDEVVHHINEDKSDDRPENLYIFPCLGKHTGYHHLKTRPVLISNLII